MNTICCKMDRSIISQAVMKNQPAGKKELRTLPKVTSGLNIKTAKGDEV